MPREPKKHDTKSKCIFEVYIYASASTFFSSTFFDNKKNPHPASKVESFARRNFRIIFTESDQITEAKLRLLCSRSVSIHGLYEIFDSGSTYDELNERLKTGNDEHRRQYYPMTFSFRIEMTNRHKMPMPERIAKFESLVVGLPMTGSVNLKEPQVQLALIEDYPPSINNKKKTPDQMEKVTLGRFMCGGQRRSIIE